MKNPWLHKEVESFGGKAFEYALSAIARDVIGVLLRDESLPPAVHVFLADSRVEVLVISPQRLEEAGMSHGQILFYEQLIILTHDRYNFKGSPLFWLLSEHYRSEFLHQLAEECRRYRLTESEHFLQDAILIARSCSNSKSERLFNTRRSRPGAFSKALQWFRGSRI